MFRELMHMSDVNETQAGKVEPDIANAMHMAHARIFLCVAAVGLTLYLIIAAIGWVTGT
jgi:hypothetical protein